MKSIDPVMNELKPDQRLAVYIGLLTWLKSDYFDHGFPFLCNRAAYLLKTMYGEELNIYGQAASRDQVFAALPEFLQLKPANKDSHMPWFVVRFQLQDVSQYEQIREQRIEFIVKCIEKVSEILHFEESNK